MTPDLRALLEAIVSNVDDAITVVEPTGRFVFVNDRAAKLLGFASADELLRAAPREVRDRYQVVDEHRQPVAMAQLPAARAFSAETPPEMLVGWRKSLAAELRWSITRSVPLKGPDGKVQVVINFFKDVTEKLRREAEERFLATATVLFSQSFDIDLTLQKLAQIAVPELADWAIVELVDEPGARPRRVAMAHIDPVKLELAKEVGRRWPPDWDPSSKTGVAAVLRTGEPQMIPLIGRELLERVAKSPEHLELLEKIGMHSWLCVPLRAHGRGVLGAVTLVTAEGRRTYEEHDLGFALEFGRRAGTAVENARLFAALEHANAQKDEFLAMLGHELRNPLAPMVNAIQQMKQQPETAERARKVLERQLEQLRHLIDDLLDVSRISRGKVELEREPLDLCELINEVAEDHLDPCLGAGLELRVECDQKAPVFGDRVRLQQVAGNLLGNAMKFTPRDGSVTLRVAVAGGRAELTVTDTGEGVDAATLPRLFQPFVQARRELDRKSGGLGLGLAVVRGIVELHGGEVSVTSAGLGKGTTFTVRLPLAEQVRPAAPLQPASPAPPPGRALRELRVLIIDDNVDLASTMRDLLAYEAKEVEVEHSGLLAVETIRRIKPDVVICDIGLPEKDGYAIAREVRADPALNGIRLVALTGYGMDGDKERAEKAGFSLHLTKPVPPQLLIRLLDGA